MHLLHPLLLSILFPIICSLPPGFLFPEQFQLVFSNIEHEKVEKLVETLNLNIADADDSSSVKDIQNFMDEQWSSAPLKPLYPAPFTDIFNKTYLPLSPSNDPELAHNETLNLIKHRRAVKTYLRFIHRVTTVFQYFSRQQADKMRDVFWMSDALCHNFWQCTEQKFYVELEKTFEGKNLDFIMINLNTVARNFAENENTEALRFLYWKLN